MCKQTLLEVDGLHIFNRQPQAKKVTAFFGLSEGFMVEIHNNVQFWYVAKLVKALF